MSHRSEPGILLYTTKTILKHVRIVLDIPRSKLFLYTIYTGSESKRPRQHKNCNNNDLPYHKLFENIEVLWSAN
jgi:hypothetical protein